MGTAESLGLAFHTQGAARCGISHDLPIEREPCVIRDLKEARITLTKELSVIMQGMGVVGEGS